MKHLKRWLALALALCLILGIVPAGVLAAEPAPAEPAAEEVKVFRPDLSRCPLTYVVTGDNTITITGTTAEKTSTATLVIPSTIKVEYENLPVTAIAPGAFEGCGMEKVSVESNLQTIGAGAFKDCTGLQKIWLPKTVTAVEADAVAGCTALTEAVYGGDAAGWAGIFAAGNEALSGLTPALGQLMPGTRCSVNVGKKSMGFRVSPEADSAIFDYCDVKFNVIEIPDAVTFPDQTELPVVCVGANAMKSSKMIYGIAIPESVTEIGDHAFDGCGEAEIYNSEYSPELPADLTWIGESAFSSCGKMQLDQILPEGLTHLGNYAFNGCGSLNGVPVIPKSLESFPHGVFSGCHKIHALKAAPDHPTYKAADGMLLSRDGKVLVSVPAGMGGRVRVPDKVEVIGSLSFEGSLAECIELPDGLLRIEADAFKRTYFTPEFYLPASIECIMEDADSLWGYGRRAPIYYGGTEEQWLELGMKIEDKDLLKCSASRDQLAKYIKCGNGYIAYEVNSEGTIDLLQMFVAPDDTLELPAEIDGTPVTGIRACFFPGNGGYQDVVTLVIPEGIRYLEDSAFQFGVKLKQIRLPASLTDCEPHALDGMESLESFEVAEGNPIFKSENGLLLSKDGSTLLRFPKGRDSLEIPGSVTKISGEIFKEAQNLKNITVDSGNMAFKVSSCEITGGGNMPVLLSQDEKTVILNPQGSYLADGAMMKFPDTVTAIGDYAFYTVEKLSFRLSNAELQLPAKLTSIGAHAFEGCQELTVSAALPENLTSIGAQAFPAQWADKWADKGEKLTIPASVTELGGNPFTSCRFDAIELAEGNKSFKIQNDLLMSADGKEVICGANTEAICIPDGVTVIREGAFKDCDRLVNLTLPKSLTTIEAEAFRRCTGLKELKLPRAVEEIGEYAFASCTGLEQLVLPPQLKIIRNQAFAHLLGIKTLVLPESLERIYPFGLGTFPKTADVYYPGTEEQWKKVHVGKWNRELNTMTIRFGEPVEPGLPAFYGASMTAANSLEMNFYVEKADLGGRTDLYAKITKTYADGREAVVKTVPFNDWKESGDLYGMTFDGIAAKEMTDQILVQIFDENDAPVTEVWTDSVHDYALRGLKKPDGQESEKRVLVDMLNYGTAAQKYFNYNTENPANADIDEYQKYATGEVSGQDRRVKDDHYYASSLTLKSNIILTMYFTDVTPDMRAELTYEYHGENKTIEVSGSDFIKRGDLYGVEMKELVVADIGKDVTCTIYDADGSKFASATDSMESYIARGGSEEEIYTAVLKFGRSAHRFFAK